MADMDERYSQEVEQRAEMTEAALVLAMLALLASENNPSPERITQVVSGIIGTHVVALLTLMWAYSGLEAEPDWGDLPIRMQRTAADLMDESIRNLLREANLDPNSRGELTHELHARLRNIIESIVTTVTSETTTAAAVALGYSSKTWHTRLDARVRVSHQSLEGQTVSITEPFRDFLGVKLQYPGDRSAPIETWINCRCTLSFSDQKDL